tara:strand:- start:1366 stop:2001 length:636 start_codon:yes stop_codon:yes gene_type:complete
MNKYYKLLKTILKKGKSQTNKKGSIIYLINQKLSLYTKDLDLLFADHKIPKKLLEKELQLYMEGIVSVDKYKEQKINWWDYCYPTMINTYPTYFKKLPDLILKINKEKRPSKNYVLFIGETGVKTSQLPCLSLIQFQIIDRKLWITVYQRSADSNLGLPCDIYHIKKIADKIDIPLKNITFFIGNAHIYTNNIYQTENLLSGREYKFKLNV